MDQELISQIQETQKADHKSMQDTRSEYRQYFADFKGKAKYFFLRYSHFTFFIV